MHKAILGILLAATATAGQAAVTIDFNSPSGNLGTSETYTSGSLSVTAYGYDGLLGGNTLDLYGKNGGGDENGLGLAGDPSGDNEIWGDAFTSAIVLDVTDLLAGGVTGAQFFMNSTTAGESWEVWADCGSGCWFNIATWNGSDEGVLHDLPNWGSVSQYGFTVGSGGGNVLLGGLSLTEASVPEPGTWAMMLLGFGAVGFSMRRRRQAEVTIRQAA